MSNNNNNEIIPDFIHTDFARHVHDHFTKNENEEGFRALDILQVFTDESMKSVLNTVKNPMELTAEDRSMVNDFMMNMHKTYKDVTLEDDVMIPIRQIDNPEDLNNYIVGQHDNLFEQFQDYQCFLWFMYIKGEMLNNQELDEQINIDYDGIRCLLYMVDVIQKELITTRKKNENFVQKISELINKKI